MEKNILEKKKKQEKKTLEIKLFWQSKRNLKDTFRRKKSIWKKEKFTKKNLKKKARNKTFGKTCFEKKTDPCVKKKPSLKKNLGPKKTVWKKNKPLKKKEKFKKKNLRKNRNLFN